MPKPVLSKKTIQDAIDEIKQLKSMKGGESPNAVTKDLQQLAWNTMLVDVNEDLLNQAIDGIIEIYV